MTTVQLLILVIIFFVTSIISVVTGSTSIITVPAMFELGVEARSAIATNMLALTLMSLGGTLPFIGKGVINRKRLPLLILLTLAGSILGALLVLIVLPKTIPLMISVAAIAVVIFTLAQRDAGIVPAEGTPSPLAEILGYAATFVLGIYGGFFSGGYVTLLTAAYVLFFRMTFIEAIATTKLINIFSSLISTLIFMGNGVVNYSLGIVLGIAMFIGALVGARVTLKLSNLWLRRIFLAVAIALPLKTLLSHLTLIIP